MQVKRWLHLTHAKEPAEKMHQVWPELAKQAVLICVFMSANGMGR